MIDLNSESVNTESVDENEKQIRSLTCLKSDNLKPYSMCQTGHKYASTNFFNYWDLNKLCGVVVMSWTSMREVPGSKLGAPSGLDFFLAQKINKNKKEIKERKKNRHTTAINNAIFDITEWQF